MRSKLKSLLIALPFFLITGTAFAHSGADSEIGFAHVMTSAEHLIGFLLVGVSAALLMMLKRPAHIALAIVVAGLYVLMQGAEHAAHGGEIFGFETIVAGSILAIGAGRFTHVAFKHFSAKKSASRS
ncbi:MAG: hypothetical protein MI743_04310 [Sneathiellales bacterium]|nr:hypothetical protein [Sneathiellales bacterium]